MLSIALDDIQTWLALSFVPGLGPAKLLSLFKAYSCPADIFSASKHELSSLGLDSTAIAGIARPKQKDVEQAMAWAQRPDQHIITWHSRKYPSLLREIPGAPPLFYLRGKLDVLHSPQLAMVGSRNPTPTGRDTAHAFARDLSSAGLTITSGLAIGIDTASHEGALDAQGITIAVLGTGLEYIYPARNKGLAERICERGAIISEFPLKTLGQPANFPRRNRLISGLSTGVLVVEAALKSGSLITANYALEQGREVFAIPGSIHNPLARGCHAILRQGAKLTETSADILEELAPLVASLNTQKSGAQQTFAFNGLDFDHQKLVKCIGFEVTTVDIIMQRSGLGADVITSMLPTLELFGMITSVPGGYIRIARG